MDYTSRELAVKIAKIMDLKKAQDLSVLQVSDVTSIADYFVVATGNSSTQVKAFCDEIEFKLKQEDIHVKHIEGHDSRSWIVMDYYSVIVHIFDPEAKAYYDLERLWSDAQKIDSAEYVTEN
ncbi:MAG: ribosome silencing factor [Oscillospiraceae bacterium]|jgi:ribosome-associated protein|nr:ribosome silencing factor [Oscillospiraceae bacterium]